MVHLISIAYTAVGSRVIYIVPVCYVKTGIEGPSIRPIIISLYRKFFLIITNIPLIINKLIITIIRVIIIHENLLEATSKWCRRHANEFVMSRQDCMR